MKAFSAPDFVPCIRGQELQPVSPSAVCGAVADPPFTLTRWGELWVPSSASRTTPFTPLSFWATTNLLSALSPEDKIPIHLRLNLLFTVHNYRFLSFQTCRTHLLFRRKYRTGQDTVTCTALPNLLPQLITPWWNLHFLPTKLWLISLSTTVKMTVLEKRKFLHHQFFQNSSFYSSSNNSRAHQVPAQFLAVQ